jgi:hypothetical protein
VVDSEKAVLEVALASFAASRRYDVDNIILFSELTDYLSGFVDRFEKKLSKEDLVVLGNGFDGLLSFYQSCLKSKGSNLLPS